MKQKKNLFLVIMLLTIAAVLAACNSNDGKEAEAPADTSGEAMSQKLAVRQKKQLAIGSQRSLSSSLLHPVQAADGIRRLVLLPRYWKKRRLLNSALR